MRGRITNVVTIPYGAASDKANALANVFRQALAARHASTVLGVLRAGSIRWWPTRGSAASNAM